MSAAAVALVVTSGERHEGKAGMVLLLLQVKLCDPCLSALYVPCCEKALYKYSSFPFLYIYKSEIGAVCPGDWRLCRGLRALATTM